MLAIEIQVTDYREDGFGCLGKRLAPARDSLSNAHRESSMAGSRIPADGIKDPF